MFFLNILWLCCITFFDSLLLFGLMHKFIFRHSRPGFGPLIAAFAMSFLIHIATAVLLTYQTSIGLAIVANSLLGLVWGLFFYFLLNRFAHIAERSANAFWMPIISFMFFLSSIVSLWQYISWYWAALPLGIWFILGFVCVEIKVRIYMRDAKEYGYKSDRKSAIVRINNNQGREHVGETRLYGYPFP